MRKNYIGLFDVIGPVMVGPSSSHTSGAASIAWTARQIFTGTPVKVSFILYGSFAQTYMGHGTDRALVGGMLGYRSNDERIRNSFEHAEEAGLEFSFKADNETEVAHPNTVDIIMETADGYELRVRGESLGGGRMRITKLNKIRVDFTGERSTLIVEHRDEKGVAAFITSRFAVHELSIAYMSLFRGKSENHAYTIIESDDFLSEELREELLGYHAVMSVEIIQL